MLSLAAVLVVASSGAAFSQEAEDKCLVPPSQGVLESAKPPKKKRGMPDLTAQELREWGPVRIQAVISCEGDVVDVRIADEIPKDLEEKIRSNLKGWRFRPASIDGEPIAMPFNLVLSDRGLRQAR
jgi:hypothetical protein